MVKGIAKFFSLPTELAKDQGAMIFDFSGVKRLECPAKCVDGIFVCAAGDALQEPFWPEGLGIIRGFFAGLDAASAIMLAVSGNTEAAIMQLALTYNVLKSVTAQSASQCLQKDVSRYRLSPDTRYILGRGGLAAAADQASADVQLRSDSR